MFFLQNAKSLHPRVPTGVFGPFIRAMIPALFVALSSAPLQAKTVTYALDGAAGGSQVLLSDQAVSQSFTMNATLTDASIMFDVLCVTCEGEIYLITGTPRVGAAVAQFETNKAYSASGSTTLGLTGRTLEAGQEYSLIWSIFDGDGFWRSTFNPVETSPIASYGMAGFTDDVDQGYPANSDFTDLSSFAKFRIEGTALAAVPLPASQSMILAALALLGTMRARRSRRVEE